MNSILNITDGIICHQVNCQNVMGAGIAKAIYEKYPKVKELYHKRCNMYKNQTERSKALYGHYQIIKITDTLSVANIFSQDKFGNGHKNGIQFTNPEYLIYAITAIALDYPEKKIYVPEKIGCGYGGGNWTQIHGMLKRAMFTCDNIIIVPSKEIEKELENTKTDDIIRDNFDNIK